MSVMKSGQVVVRLAFFFVNVYVATANAGNIKAQFDIKQFPRSGLEKCLIRQIENQYQLNYVSLQIEKTTTVNALVNNTVRSSKTMPIYLRALVDCMVLHVFDFPRTGKKTIES